MIKYGKYFFLKQRRSGDNVIIYLHRPEVVLNCVLPGLKIGRRKLDLKTMLGEKFFLRWEGVQEILQKKVLREKCTAKKVGKSLSNFAACPSSTQFTGKQCRSGTESVDIVGYLIIESTMDALKNYCSIDCPCGACEPAYRYSQLEQPSCTTGDKTHDTSRRRH